MDRELALNVIRAQIAVVKSSLATAHVAMSTIERILESEVPDATPPAETAARPAEEVDDAPGLITPERCDHPRQARMKTAVMGKPNRWLCNVCGYEGEE